MRIQKFSYFISGLFMLSMWFCILMVEPGSIFFVPTGVSGVLLLYQAANLQEKSHPPLKKQRSDELEPHPLAILLVLLIIVLIIFALVTAA